MIKNGKDYNNQQLTADVCIAGSGPAGITLAWELISKNPDMKVILIDGSRDLGDSGNYWKNNWPNKEWLYNGVADGQFATNEPQFLIRPNSSYSTGAWERERTYGGTSAHWGGQSRPLDPITFEGVDGYPGWPINHNEMEQYYAQAAELCMLNGDNFTAEYWAEQLDAEVPTLSGFNTEMYQFMAGEYLNFATRTFGDEEITIGESPVLVIRNASLLDFEHANGSVQHMRVGSMTDDGDPPKQATEFTIKADKYVLALGAVANARQMLLSEVPNDNIGRYFMCHPLVAPYINGGVSPIRLSSEFLNASELKLMSGNNGESLPPNGVKVTGRFIPNAVKTKELGIGRCWFWAGTNQNFYFEQAPNPDSRITLADSQDPIFGQAQTHIHWEFCDRDENTYNQLIQLYTEAVHENNPDIEVTCDTWDSIKSRAVVNGHHMGTTRMSTSADNGVVDENLQCHELDNMYIAGSSVWPSAGISNPTFTIIALSIRLADHLA